MTENNAIEQLTGLRVQEEIRKELGPGELVLWSGQPGRGFVLRASDIVMIPFSLLWTVFAVNWLLAVMRSGAPLSFALFGVPFVLVGVYMVAGRFWVEARQRAQTFYAVTPQRVLVISGFFTRKVKSLNLRMLSDLTLNERSDGSGAITFGPQHPLGFMIHGMPGWPGTDQYLSPRFDLVPDVRKVYEIIREAQRKA